MSTTAYVRYDKDVETLQPNEDEMTEEIVASMGRQQRTAFDRHRHAHRDAHAKSHGFLKGTLTINADLDEPLRQGLFREPGSYDVITRFSTAPGDIQNDSIRAPRGFAIKVIGVGGKKMLPEQEDEVTQDFLLVNMPVIPFGDVESYLQIQTILERHGDDPDVAKRIAAALAKGANRALKLIGRESPTLYGLSPPNTHPLGETFYSMAAIRYGDYIAKVRATPRSENIRRLAGELLDTRDRPSAIRDAIVDYFKAEGAEYDIQVQLCTDLEKMPIEDASVEWPEDDSPYRTVGRLAFSSQEANSPARRVYGDDVLTFNPWHCIPEHQPLGSIMRIRVPAYERSTTFRHDMNMEPRQEPRTIGDIPD